MGGQRGSFLAGSTYKNWQLQSSPSVQTQTISQHLQAAVTGDSPLHFGCAYRGWKETTGILMSLGPPPWPSWLAKPGQIFTGINSDTFPMKEMP